MRMYKMPFLSPYVLLPAIKLQAAQCGPSGSSPAHFLRCIGAGRIGPGMDSSSHAWAALGRTTYVVQKYLFEAKSCMNTPKYLIPWRQCRAFGINGRLLGDRAT